MKNNHWLTMTLVGFGLGLLLLPVGVFDASTTHANPGILYVSATDPTCGGQSPCFTTIQAAVDAAVDGDEIFVAAGIYSGSTPRMVSDTTYTQVVLVTKSLILQGGYTTTNWTTPDPVANPTVIDARRRGRGISIVGDGFVVVMVAGFTITGGDYTGLGNPPDVGHQACVRTGSDCGGGLFAYRATLLLRDSVITDNIASRTRDFSDGGGAYLWLLNADSRIENTTFTGNTIRADGGEGGGMHITFTNALTVTNSRFEGNQASGAGGGLFIFQPDGQVAIEQTAFMNNTAGDEGGALDARLTLPDNALRLDRVTMRGNQARGQGAALSLSKAGEGDTTVELTNVVLATNSLTSPGNYSAVINASGGSGGDLELRMAHLTWTDHRTLGALRLDASSGRPITAQLVNGLMNSAAAAYIGNQRDGAVRIQHTHTLTNLVVTLHATQAGMPIFEAINPLTGNPRLDATYHLQAGSAAIDAGVNAGVLVDLDGDTRPLGAGYDIGADEFVPPSAK